ncbi:hypothetical protein [Nostoc sp. DSM 114167]|uniref:hypothetical protein n=1 Tax=Nostoc sp. DSM 114167 TaxID=3439050 RepID=UPI0040451B70
MDREWRYTYVNDKLAQLANLLQMMSAIATKIGQFIEQQRSSSLLREREEKYRQIFEIPGVSIGEENSTIVK